MTTRTYKSVSGTRKTSSRSSTAAETAATASDQKRKKRRGMGKYAKVVAHLENMSAEEFRRALVSAGIITKAGNLKAKYKRAEHEKRHNGRSNGRVH